MSPVAQVTTANEIRGAIRHHDGRITELANARRSWKQRGGLLLRIEDGDGGSGVGEASPLDDYSPDSLEQAHDALDAWLASRPTIDEGLDPLDAVAQATRDIGPPSARCAAETALLDLIGRRRGVPLYRLLGGERHASELAGLLLTGSRAKTLERAARLVRGGLRTLKVKVGGDPRHDLKLLLDLSERFGGWVRLRLDANGVLKPEEVAERLDGWAAFFPEFIEEPLSGADLLALDASPIPVALDETLQASRVDGADDATTRWRRLEPWLDRGLCGAVVLKPMVLGLLDCLRFAELARARGLGVVVSHTFDGPVALHVAASLAIGAGDGRACGLVRHIGLEVWPLVETPLVGRLRLRPERAGAGIGLDGDAVFAAMEG